jgi:hypothetical protein
MIERYATVAAWAKWFELKEGVDIAGVTIWQRLKSANKIGESARSNIVGILRNCLYSESEVRRLCADLLQPGLPRCGKDGFAIIAGVRYGTIATFEHNLGICKTTISSRLESIGLAPVTGKSVQGKLVRLWPEDQVREICPEILDQNLPRCGNGGFVEIAGVKYGAIKSLARRIGCSVQKIKARLMSSGINSVRGRDKVGRTVKLYPEPTVREACDKTPELPSVRGYSNFLEINGVRYGTARSIARKFGVSYHTIFYYLAPSNIKPMCRREKGGQLVDFWPEPQVRKLLGGLLDPSLPLCQKDGFADIHGVRHGTIPVLARFLEISEPTISKRLVVSSIASVRGKDKSGHLADLYPEPRVRELCKDLLEKKAKKA